MPNVDGEVARMSDTRAEKMSVHATRVAGYPGELFAHVAGRSIHVPNVDGPVAQTNDTPPQMSVLATQVDDG